MEKEAGNKKYFETEFINVNSRECTLLIEFNEEGFSYTIFQDSTNEVLYSAISHSFLDFYHSTEQHFSEIISRENLFKYTFGKVVILIDTFYTTLVPTSFFDKSKIREVLEFNMVIPNVEFVYLNDRIPSIEYANLFVNTKSLNNSIVKNFVSSEVYSTNSIIVAICQKLSKGEEYFHIHLGLKKFQCVFYKNDKLLFCNSFNYENAEEVLFNVLNVYKQFGLNNEFTILNMSGAISIEHSIYKLLYTYFKFIEFSNRPVKLNYSDNVKQMSEHYFMHHYAALL